MQQDEKSFAVAAAHVAHVYAADWIRAGCPNLTVLEERGSTVGRMKKSCREFVGATTDLSTRTSLQALGLDATRDVTILDLGGNTVRFAAMQAQKKFSLARTWPTVFRQTGLWKTRDRKRNTDDKKNTWRGQTGRPSLNRGLQLSRRRPAKEKNHVRSKSRDDNRASLLRSGSQWMLEAVSRCD